MLMKKISLLLVGVLALFSCEQEGLDNIMEISDVEQVKTRTAGSIADLDPIIELDGIPVNILNVGNTKRKYLSSEKSGTKLVLNSQDDGSGRQRWKIARQQINAGTAILLEKGNSGIVSNKVAAIFPDPYNYGSLGDNIEKPTNIKLLCMVSGSILPVFNFTPIADNKWLISRGYGSPFSLSTTYLRSKSSTSSDMTFNDDSSTDLSKWQIVPVGEYELVDLEYVRTTVDSFEPTEVICDHDEYTNEHLSVDTWNYSLSTSYTEESNFSKTEGVSVTISGGLSVGIPNVLGDDSSLGVNVSVQQQTNKSWTYGTSDSKTVTKTRTGQIPIQPGETVKLDAVLVMYKGSLTYVATLRKIGDTKTFRVKGKWSGDCFSSFEARTYNPTTGKLVGEYVLE